MSQDVSAVQPDAIAPAMWSIYYHSTNLPTLRRSILQLVPAPAPLRLVSLSDAVDAVLTAGAGTDDRRARLLRLQALRKLASMGLANPAYREFLRRKPHTDSETASMIEETGKIVDRLVERVWQEFGLEIPIDAFRLVAPSQANAYLDEGLARSGACAPVATSCVACYSPRGAAGGEPITTITAGCYVKRDFDCLAKAFDPRSWHTCAPDAFKKSQRVTYSSATHTYTDVPTSPGDIGHPWTGYLEEQVVVGGDAEFQNFLEIEFHIAPNVRVDYQLFESKLFSIPALFIFNQNESVVVDEGHLLAEISTNPLYPASANWKRIELVKTVRFVDLTDLPDSNPWNIDAGEVLNYWAPALLSEWLESSTQGAVCCNNC